MGLSPGNIGASRENRYMIRSNNKCNQCPFSRSISSDLYTTMASLAFRNDLIWGEGPSRLLDPRVDDDLQALIKLLDENEQKFLDMLREAYDDNHQQVIRNELVQLALKLKLNTQFLTRHDMTTLYNFFFTLKDYCSKEKFTRDQETQICRSIKRQIPKPKGIHVNERLNTLCQMYLTQPPRHLTLFTRTDHNIRCERCSVKCHTTSTNMLVMCNLRVTKLECYPHSKRTS